jgi:hypothetical protein
MNLYYFPSWCESIFLAQASCDFLTTSSQSSPVHRFHRSALHLFRYRVCGLTSPKRLDTWWWTSADWLWTIRNIPCTYRPCNSPLAIIRAQRLGKWLRDRYGSVRRVILTSTMPQSSLRMFESAKLKINNNLIIICRDYRHWTNVNYMCRLFFVENVSRYFVR